MPRRSIAEVKVLDVQKRRIPNKHYVSGSALRGSGSSAAPGPALGKQRPGAAGPPGAPGGRRAALPAVCRSSRSAAVRDAGTCRGAAGSAGRGWVCRERPRPAVSSGAAPKSASIRRVEAAGPVGCPGVRGSRLLPSVPGTVLLSSAELCSVPLPCEEHVPARSRASSEQQWVCGFASFSRGLRFFFSSFFFFNLLLLFTL